MLFFFQRNNLNEFPSYIHSWAQSDYYALSKGFVRNNLNFFINYKYYHTKIMSINS